MILGIGNDVVDIRRIEAALARQPERFLTRIYTPAERELAQSRPARTLATLAGRFAAKEAAAKALSTGFTQGLRWHDIEILREESGKPRLMLHGAALGRLHALTPPGHRAHAQLTLADEYPYSWAVVLLEARPE